jgi:DNA excision repair protein ERCC-8
MNQLLFERSTGSLSPNAFARIYSTRLIYEIQAAPDIKFDGGEAPAVSRDDARHPDTRADLGGDDSTTMVAHRAGVNALVVDRFEGRL